MPRERERPIFKLFVFGRRRYARLTCGEDTIAPDSITVRMQHATHSLCPSSIDPWPTIPET